MTHEHRPDPLEIRVLAALTSGTATVAEVAFRTGQPETVVGPVLEQALVERAVTRIDLAQAPVYSLTPKGLHAVGVSQGARGVAANAGQVDLRAADQEADRPTDDGTPERVSSALPTGLDPVPVAPQASQVSRVEVDHEPRKVQWRHVVYAAAYVLLGLFLLFFQPVIGLVALVAGLVLGGYTLRPLFRSGSARVTSP